MRAPSSTNDAITITRRHPLIGAEIRGIDLGRVDDQTFRRICDAWLEHLLLVFPEQNITDEEQIASPVASANSRSIPRASTA